MTGISLTLPADLSSSLADLARTNGESASYLDMDILRDHIEHQKTLTAQIELRLQPVPPAIPLCAGGAWVAA